MCQRSAETKAKLAKQQAVGNKVLRLLAMCQKYAASSLHADHLSSSLHVSQVDQLSSEYGMGRASFSRVSMARPNLAEEMSSSGSICSALDLLGVKKSGGTLLEEAIVKSDDWKIRAAHAPVEPPGAFSKVADCSPGQSNAAGGEHHERGIEDCQHGSDGCVGELAVSIRAQGTASMQQQHMNSDRPDYELLSDQLVRAGSNQAEAAAAAANSRSVSTADNPGEMHASSQCNDTVLICLSKLYNQVKPVP
jgi:hypothetical protein